MSDEPQTQVRTSTTTPRCGKCIRPLLGRSSHCFEREGSPAAAVLDRLLARETVLIVDRDPRVFLAGECAVEVIDDGYSALDRVGRDPPAALITEILIPRLDGLALCLSLEGDAATVPILVISMLAAQERARLSGADAFLALCSPV